MIVFVVVYLAVLVLMVASLWKVFEKAGEPGWVALVPFYNMYVLTTSVAGKEVLWFLLCFVPFVNFIAFISIYISVAQRFGQSVLFGLGLIFLPFICWPVLAFGGAEHDSQQRSRRRSPGRGYGAYEDDEEYERPAKRRRNADEEDDDEDDRPSKRRVVDEDEDRPAKRGRYEDDEDDRPAKKRRPAADEDDFDDRPSKRRRNRDDDEDDRPARRRRDD